MPSQIFLFKNLRVASPYISSRGIKDGRWLQDEPTGDFTKTECSQLGFKLPGFSGGKIEGSFAGRLLDELWRLVANQPRSGRARSAIRLIGKFAKPGR
jgi:hypothetical protein